jgi:hypothetical protein
MGDSSICQELVATHLLGQEPVDIAVSINICSLKRPNEINDP